jgi:glycosyltransferase involved in cell wall biosynthesis
MKSPQFHQIRSGHRPRLLFFTRILPEPGSSGAGTYTFDLLSHLEENGCEIRVTWTEPPYEFQFAFHNLISAQTAKRFDVRVEDYLRVGRHLLKPSAVWLPFKAKLFHFIKTLLGPLWIRRRPKLPVSGAPTAIDSHLSWGAPCTRRELNYLRRQIDAFEPDILIANYPWLLAGLDAIPALPPVWVLTHDYRFRRCQITPDGQFAKVILTGPQVVEEQRWLALSQVVIAIQENEAALFREERGNYEVITAGMAAARIPAVPPAEAAVCAFLGSNNKPNADAARWFATRVWPLVLRSHPDARFHIAGGVCKAVPELATHRSINLVGIVDSISDFYGSSALVVVPLLEGSGVKIKLLEAVAHGRTCVTTSVGLDGLEMLQPALAVANTPEVFADAVIRLLANPGERNSLGALAYKLAQQHLSPEACYGPLAERAHQASR